MTHQTIADHTFLGMALSETIKQLNLQDKQQHLFHLLIKSIDKNLPQISIDSLKNKITLNVEEVQTTEAPESKENRRFQYYRGILHNVRYQAQDEFSTLFNEQKKFAIIELIGDNNAKPMAQKTQKLMAKSVPKRQKTFPSEGGRKSKRVG